MNQEEVESRLDHCEGPLARSVHPALQSVPAERNRGTLKDGNH